MEEGLAVTVSVVDGASFCFLAGILVRFLDFCFDLCRLQRLKKAPVKVLIWSLGEDGFSCRGDDGKKRIAEDMVALCFCVSKRLEMDEG